MKKLENKSSKTLPRILCLADYYCPGYKAGGPIKTLKNLFERLESFFDFRLITRGHEYGSSISYPNVQLDSWQCAFGITVFYTAKKYFDWMTVLTTLRTVRFDILYINSVLSIKFSFLPLLLLRTGKWVKAPCIVAPRGELSEGALQLKQYRKRIFFTCVKAIGLHSKVVWQASSEKEKKDILRMFPESVGRIIIAPDIPSIWDVENNPLDAKENQNRDMKIIFLSRVSPMKNLDFFLRALKFVNLPCQLGIYGPIEDEEYWKTCTDLIAELPTSIEVQSFGAIEPEKVIPIIAEYDLFVLPTRGENYGHVVLEALTAGTPVVLSDQTLWTSDNSNGALTILKLDEELWSNTLTSLLSKPTALRSARQAARQYADSVINNPAVIEKNLELFNSVLPSSNKR